MSWLKCWSSVLGKKISHLNLLSSPVAMKSQNSYSLMYQVFPKVEFWEYQSGLIRTFHLSEVRPFCLDKVKGLCFSFWFGSSLTQKMMEACSLEDMLLPEKSHGLFFQASSGRSSLKSNSSTIASFTVIQKPLEHSGKGQLKNPHYLQRYWNASLLWSSAKKIILDTCHRGRGGQPLHLTCIGHYAQPAQSSLA